MILSTVLNLYIIPVLYVFAVNLVGRRAQKRPPDQAHGDGHGVVAIEAEPISVER